MSGLQAEISSWFNPVWQPQAELRNGKAQKTAQPSPNPSDLTPPHAMDYRAFVPLCGWCREETNDHSPLKRACVCPEWNPSFCVRHSERSRGIWPTIVRGFPFEARFLRYVMLRITSVGMTTSGLSFFNERSTCFLGVNVTRSLIYLKLSEISE